MQMKAEKHVFWPREHFLYVKTFKTLAQKFRVFVVK
jgi:hypothetical protein